MVRDIERQNDEVRSSTREMHKYFSLGDISWRYMGPRAAISGFRRVVFTFQQLRTAHMAIDVVWNRPGWWVNAGIGGITEWRWCAVQWVIPTHDAGQRQ